MTTPQHTPQHTPTTTPTTTAAATATTTTGSQTPPVVEPLRETRFALVLNGGVSLAVWMGGVTHEVNRLRLASNGTKANPSGKELAVHGAWAKILEETKRTAFVDVMAGTSAGGLNGTLLAKAVAGGTDLPDMRKTWSEVASLSSDSLLGETSANSRKSLLDGDFFVEQVNRKLGQIDTMEQVAERQDCTLLVTATAIGCEHTDIPLEGEATINMVDSRRVYKFERRTDDRKKVTDHFADLETITTAARASASFPAAFEPVWETEHLRQRRLGSKTPPCSHLIDGGVLDNAPFGPLIETLQGRPVNSLFERVVLYVTPSPGGGPVKSLGKTPGIAAVLGRVFGAAREPDQRLDVETLQAAFAQMGFTRSAPHEPLRRLLCNDSADLPGAEALAAANHYFRTYRQTRAEAVERWLESLAGVPRLAMPSEPELDLDDIHSVPDAFQLSANDWHWGIATAERAARWWGRMLVDMAAAGRKVPDAAFARVEELQQTVVRLWSELDAHMDTDQKGMSLGARAQKLNQFYLDKGKGPELRQALDETAAQVAALSSGGAFDGPKFLEMTLALEVISSVLAWGWSSEGDTPRFRYGQVTPAAPSSVDLGSIVNDENWPARKLYGQRWGHFGAFASDTGRRADWLWGRLDGATTLFDYLMREADGTPVVTATDPQVLKNDLIQAILDAEGSSEDDLRDAARTALELEPGDLLDQMSTEDRKLAAHVLWTQAKALMAPKKNADPTELTPIAMARAFADPTWTKKDAPKRLGFRDRAKLRLIRWYGYPARKIGSNKATEKLGI